MKRNTITQRILSMLLCAMMMVSCLATTASALSLEDNEEDDEQDYYQDTSSGLQLENNEDGQGADVDNDVTWLTVYVDNVKVKNVDVFIDGDDGEVYVSSYKDVKRIFPDETDGLFFAEEEEATPLSYWAGQFGYYLSRSGSKVYLTNGYPDEIQIPTLDDEDDENQSATINGYPAVKVYVNGMKIANPGTYLDDEGNVRLSDPRSMYNIMPMETNGRTIYSNGSTFLKVWADYFKYSYAQRGLRVYLSNNGFEPLEIHLSWDIIDFPDQQPCLKDNRTMIPVRSVAETLGWKVDYNDAQVAIVNGEHTVVLFIGSKSYTLDGKEKALDVPAQIVNGRTMVPIRFVAEAFGYTVNYDGSGAVRVVTLTKN